MRTTQRQTNHHRVLRAACALFCQDAYDISMDAVATQAGVSKQTVYSHFDSKQILFRAVVEELLKPLRAALSEPDAPLETVLRSFVQVYRAGSDGHGTSAIARVLQMDPPKTLPAVRDVVDAACFDSLSRLSARIRVAMERGQLRDDDPDEAAQLFFALVRSLRGGPDLVDPVVRVFLNAYRNPRPASPLFT
ncbi:TetR/AcrR family transcriptional regulator [Luteibacter aegosomaticola]|uniref:TetR/AcrR family transcriptional regulator n=1 Tax=Luteibacter aegosomaticola TaxID=2911538 RepID=UPI001FF88BA1|nr:TetR/AcrR family transcriptional regulator [Luteibacter aegosomaticola]UPG90519.1 TetR/AcrR family transcriptional regulator [Luteibacter aegosomaticola]